MRLANKVCMVTGAGKGIGREVARLFYGEGSRLALITRTVSDFKSLKAELAYDDKRVLTFTGNVSREDTVRCFVKAAIKRFGKIDVLINNAGLRFRKAFLDTTSEEWDRVIKTNLNSAYYFCREAGKNMVKRRQGVIVNIASIVGTLGLPELSAYGASKGAMIALTKCLALEWAEANVRVNAVAPGFCETSYAEDFKKKKRLYQFTLDRTPQKKWGTPHDVASACLFLATDESKYITGEVLNVDGGWSAW